MKKTMIAAASAFVSAALICGACSATVNGSAKKADAADPRMNAQPLTYTSGIAQNNPFPKGMGGSTCFRIPALVTLADGSLFAAADARWNTTYDGGGLDTMVARSKNNGKDWEWAFVNYLGDNGDAYNGAASTCFIDPALATDGKTMWLLADLCPYGVALNGSGNTHPTMETGFNGDGKLLLCKKGESSYGYYLDGNKIKAADSGAVQNGYTVDPFFNITAADGSVSHLFYENAPFQVQRTSYLYLRKSEDGGATWSDPVLLPLKTDQEKAYLVGPGRGIVTKTGMIVFPCYSYSGSNESQRMNFIYSADGGTTWKRSADSAPDGEVMWSSESAVVELPDGTLRFFFRNDRQRLCYRDYNGNAWQPTVITDNKTNSNTQLSAIVYSKRKDGKPVILVSCPTGPGRNGSNSSDGMTARLNGEIFIGTLNADNTMDWDAVKNITVTANDTQFMYSCLTELRDGRIALLYENEQHGWGAGDGKYFALKFDIFPAPF